MVATPNADEDGNAGAGGEPQQPGSTQGTPQAGLDDTVLLPRVNKHLSHYVILEKIGSGGMGTVYRARDEHLHRDVAVKALPKGALADDQARKRFRREALALSRLNHPNIETVHDFDTHEGTDFIVMEYIPGVTLQGRLTVGPLPETEILGLAEQLLEGLEAAHAQGVIHCDLKPANLGIMPDGRLKILDFGIAKLLKPINSTVHVDVSAETFVSAGTPPYMAPEQLRGDEVDRRADIYGFGAVLYEMATARRPFPQKSALALADAILRRDVEPVRVLNPAVSQGLERMILKCLEKQADNRFQSAGEALVAVRRLAAEQAAASVGTDRKPRAIRAWAIASAGLVMLALVFALAQMVGQRSDLTSARRHAKIMLAVLPFVNLSGDADQTWLCDGITEEMIAQLGRLQPQRLGVIARTSVMRYRQTDKTIEEIGRELGVSYALEGSVRRSEDRVRITSQLIHTGDQALLWSETFEEYFGDVLSIQTKVARRIAQTLSLELLPEQGASLGQAFSTDAVAVDAYHKGRYSWNKRTIEGVQKAIEFFDAAVSRDPEFAHAYAGLADCYAVLGSAGYDALPPHEAMPKVKHGARKALELCRGLAEAHTSLAYARFSYDWDLRGAEQGFRRAIELNPSYATAHQWYAHCLMAAGRVEPALAEMKQAKALDPLSPAISVGVGWCLYYARRYEEAIQCYRQTLELDPHFLTAHYALGLAYQGLGQSKDAVTEFEGAAAASGRSPFSLAALGHAYAALGRQDESRRIIDELLQLSGRRYVPAAYIGWVYVGLGDYDQAFEWFEKAYQERWEHLVYLKVEPTFDCLRSDPRFADLARRVGLVDPVPGEG